MSTKYNHSHHHSRSQSFADNLMWRWDDKINSLECRIHNPTKKSHAVKSLCRKYLNTASTKTYKRGDSFNASSMKSDAQNKEHIVSLFKRTAEAAGKVVELGKTIVKEDRIRQWTLDSAKKLALEEMTNNFKSGKISKFSKQLQIKALKNNNSNLREEEKKKGTACLCRCVNWKIRPSLNQQSSHIRLVPRKPRKTGHRKIFTNPKKLH